MNPLSAAAAHQQQDDASAMMSQATRAARSEADLKETHESPPSDLLRPWKTLYTFIVLLLPVAGVAALSIALTGSDWFWSSSFAHKAHSAELASRFEIPAGRSFAALGPIGLNSTCLPLVQYDLALGKQYALHRCRDLGDAVNGASYTASALVFVIFLSVALSVFELAAYGPFGGPYSIARLSFILALCSCAVSALGLVAWYFVLSVHFCKLPSLEETGFFVGYLWYVAAGNLVVLFLDMLYAAAAISRTSRGPPSMTIFVRTLCLCIAGLGVFGQGWLVDASAVPEVRLTGSAEACVSFDAIYPCPVLSLYGKLLIVAATVTLALGVCCVLCSAARAVDHIGLTLTWSSGFGFAFAMANIGIGTGVFGASTVDGKSCENSGVPSLFDSGFSLGTAAWMLIPGFICGIVFVAMNMPLGWAVCIGCCGEADEEDVGGGKISLSMRRGNRGMAPPIGSLSMRRALDPRSSISDASAAVVSPVRQRPRPTAAAPASSAAASTASPSPRRAATQVPLNCKLLLYHTWWFSGLVDPRTQSILQREHNDADQESGGDDDDGDANDNERDAGGAGGGDEPPEHEQERSELARIRTGDDDLPSPSPRGFDAGRRVSNRAELGDLPRFAVPSAEAGEALSPNSRGAEQRRSPAASIMDEPDATVEDLRDDPSAAAAESKKNP